MKNLNAIKSRFLRDPFNIKIGNLAADLIRLSTFLENPKNRKAVEDILEEAKFFIEWVAPEASFEVQILLSRIQSKLALWHYHLLQQKENSKEIEELKKMSKSWSTSLIEFSGILS